MHSIKCLLKKMYSKSPEEKIQTFMTIDKSVVNKPLIKNNNILIGKHNHIPDSKFDREQLKQGIKVEMEHTDNPLYAKAIAKDHLMESEKYYMHLEKMEKELNIKE